MQHLTKAVRDAVAAENWYAGLTLALALPDICGKLRSPAERVVATRYAGWFDQWATPYLFTRQVGAANEARIFLSGTDCCALRCAVLHEGSSRALTHRASDALSRFTFTAPRPGWHVHLNSSGGTLQLQVDQILLGHRDEC